MSATPQGTNPLILTDEMLVRACRSGDSAAWEELVKRYQRLVFSIPRRAGFDEAVAADIFQHVFATLLDKMDTIKEPSSIRAWLITTAKRETWRVSKQLTSTISIDNEEQNENLLELPDDKPLPEDELQQLEEQQLVRIALAELGGPCSQLLELLFYSTEPQSYESIAAIMHIPLGSIGPTRVRCLQKLRGILAQMGY
ncbi:MAG TPA: sigma-70 family RNA polymerase sigma factor [Anaerolineae bacterium]